MSLEYNYFIASAVIAEKHIDISTRFQSTTGEVILNQTDINVLPGETMQEKMKLIGAQQISASDAKFIIENNNLIVL